MQLFVTGFADPANRAQFRSPAVESRLFRVLRLLLVHQIIVLESIQHLALFLILQFLFLLLLIFLLMNLFFFLLPHTHVDLRWQLVLKGHPNGQARY